jgi:TRAP-type C4-dicarboxylate transport system permease small subunit
MNLDSVLDKIDKAFTIVGAISLMIMLVVTAADVVMSRIFNLPFPGATEVVTSAMPISVFAFLLAAQRRGRHISIDMVTARLPRKAGSALALMALLIGVFLFGLLTWLNIPLAIYSIRIGEHTGGNVAVPIYPAKVMIPLATGMITVQFLLEIYREFLKFSGRATDAHLSAEPSKIEA